MSRASEARLAETAPIFAALGDPTRLRLVTRLSGGAPLSSSVLSEGEPITRQAITKHLEALAVAGLVRDTRSGRERLWELQPRRLAAARRCLESISAQWDDALRRLATFVEDGK